MDGFTLHDFKNYFETTIQYGISIKTENEMEDRVQKYTDISTDNWFPKEVQK